MVGIGRSVKVLGLLKDAFEESRFGQSISYLESEVEKIALGRQLYWPAGSIRRNKRA
jgi:hypothetical protein